jgi:thioredoxin-like negative regulator of GroEL
MNAKIVHISDSSFEKDVLSADKPVLVDYWPNGVDRAR